MFKTKNLRALIVEDDTNLAFVWRETLAEAGFETETVTSCADAMSLVLRGGFDFVLLDYFVDDGDTSSLADWIKLRLPGAAVLIVTGTSIFSCGEHVKTVRGADWILRKPVATSELIAIAEYMTDSDHVSPSH